MAKPTIKIRRKTRIKKKKEEKDEKKPEKKEEKEESKKTKKKPEQKEESPEEEEKRPPEPKKPEKEKEEKDTKTRPTLETKGMRTTRKRREKKGGTIERVATGIEGFDGLVEGGFPKKSLVLLTGSCGTGKTIFGMNFLVEGAKKGEPGVYVSLEESVEDNIAQMKFFGWDVEKLMKEKKLQIVQPEMYRFDALMTTIEDSVDRINAKRLVLDSASVIGMYFHDVYKVRRSLLDLAQLLKKSGCTSIAISETKEGETGLSSYGVEEFVADGVVVLYYVKKKNRFLRAVTIRKMRSTDHSLHICPFDIKRPGGIQVYASEEIFTEVE